MQKEMIVGEGTPLVVSWIQVNQKLIGVTAGGDFLLLAIVEAAPAKKPKQKRRRKVIIGAAVPEATDTGNEEAPRKRGRKALGQNPLQNSKPVDAPAA